MGLGARRDKLTESRHCAAYGVPQGPALGITLGSGQGAAVPRTPTAHHKGRAVEMPRDANYYPMLNTDRPQRILRPTENPGM
jgi:hypothetical protein